MSRSQNIHFADLRHILVPPSADAQEDRFRVRPTPLLCCDPAHSVRRFECGDDAFEPAEKLKAVEGVTIGDRYIRRSTAVLEIRMLRTNARVIQARGNRVSGV